MVDTVTTAAIGRYVDFVREHVRVEYGPANIDAIGYTIVAAIETIGGAQSGLFLDNGIGSRQMKAKYALAATKQVLLKDFAVEAGANVYFGLVFHEFGHAAFDSISRNSEDGAYSVELTCMVAAVLQGLITLTAAQDYVDARVASGMFRTQFSLVKNPVWASRSLVALQYLKNKERALVSYPHLQHV